MSLDTQKKAVGEAAAARVQPNTTVGLGTGSTAAMFVAALAARRLPGLTCVATSEATAAQARGLGLSVVDLDQVARIDLTVDGADEIGPGLALIKGGGGALLREKLVWEASERRLCIADETKTANPFGTFPLPVEVVVFGHATTARRLAGVLEAAGLSSTMTLRGGETPFRTDSGNLIYDLHLGAITDPPGLAARLKAVTGVVEHGLFIRLADEALVATASGIVALQP